MQVQISRQDPSQARCDVIIVPVPEGKQAPRSLQKLDRALGGNIQRYLDVGEFKGKAGELSAFPAHGISAQTVVLVGLGEDGSADSETLRRTAGIGVKAAQKRGAKTAGLVVPRLRRISASESAQALTEGAQLGAYRFDQYRKNENSSSELESLALYTSGEASPLRRGLRIGEAMAEASLLARDLSNEPGSVHTPAWLGERARKLGREHGLKIKVLAAKELESEKMEGILSVGRGSANPPRLIVFEHNAPKRGQRRRKTVAIVGKGITFDSGGISIKPSANMHEMKHDMSGGAAVFGTMLGAARLNLPLHIVGIVPAAQNMPGGRAYLPGDIVRAASGTTIEVLNTDAEGRIVLADALHYAQRFEPEAMIDLATLTGACVIALGSACCGLMGNDEALQRRIQAAGDHTHERAWPMPLWDEHKRAIRGDVGDIKNTGGREAGTLTAGAFLSHFVGDIPWAHLDIAGTAWTNKDSAYCVKGATGFGARLMLELLRQW